MNISSRYVRRRFTQVDISSVQPSPDLFLTASHRVSRLRFARNHIHCTVNDWKNVLFSDETRVDLPSLDGHELVWKRHHEKCV